MAESRAWNVTPTGGRPILTAVEIAGMLSRLPRKYELAGRFIGCMDNSVRQELIQSLMVYLSGVAAREGWRVPRGGRILRGLATGACIEHWSPQIFHPLNEFQRSVARRIACRIKPDDWRRTWRPRYEDAYNELRDRYNTARQHVWRMAGG